MANIQNQIINDLAKIKDILLKHGNTNAIDDLGFYLQTAPTACSVCKVEPSIAIVIQGRKSMTLDDRQLVYDQTRFLITSLDLPAKMQVIEASEELPYIGLSLKLDYAIASELLSQIPLSKLADTDKEPGMVLGQSSPEIVNAFYRLVALLDDPDSIPVMAPLIKKEIYWRVLMSEQGTRLRQIVSTGSHSLKIAKSLDWLKTHFKMPIQIEQLAEQVQMSKSSYHQHFKQITSMSPLQYQKRLRLLEARRLLISEDLDAASAAFKVGYESASQFSREYSRLFGMSPKKDIQNQLSS
jgi:AraC-like DNA-binding protein